jgi:hypothetical protein
VIGRIEAKDNLLAAIVGRIDHKSLNTEREKCPAVTGRHGSVTSHWVGRENRSPREFARRRPSMGTSISNRSAQEI